MSAVLHQSFLAIGRPIHKHQLTIVQYIVQYKITQENVLDLLIFTAFNNNIY